MINMPLKDTKKRAEYQKEYRKKWYAEHKEEFKKHIAEKNKEHRKKIREWMYDYKLHCKCLNCEETDSWCLDFHHLNTDEKDGCVSRLTSSTKYVTEKLIIKELEKCVCLCSNCHRKVHKYSNGNIFQ